MQTENITDLIIALTKAQSEFDEPKRTVKAFNYFYAPMDEVIRATKKALKDNDLVISQFPINEADFVGIETVIAHKSGQYMSRQFATKPSKTDPQSIGSLITYYRRYAYMAVCGIAPEDDDASSAMPTKPVVKTETTKSNEPLNW